MPPTVPLPRLHILAARTQPVALILRRGPSKWCHVLRYCTDTDELEPGSWFRGRVFKFRSDLSDDARYMAYFAMDDKGQTWNGVCEPPDLTCLVRWKTNGTLFGGGVWTGPGRLAVNLGREMGKIPSFEPVYPTANRPYITFEQLEARYGSEDAGILYERLERDGWARQGSIGLNYRLPGKQFGVRQEGDAGWLLKHAETLPELHLFYHGYSASTGHRFEFPDA
jgi:hypothetical protein